MVLQKFKRLLSYNRFIRWVGNIHYWIVSHTIRRYHWLDLRQPKDVPSFCKYRWGWCESDNQIEFAIGNILCDFVNNQQGGEEKFQERLDWLKKESEDQSRDEWERKVNLNNYEYENKILQLYRWWKYDRVKLAKELDFILLNDSRKYNEMEQEFDKQMDQFLIGVIEIRKGMWT